VSEVQVQEIVQAIKELSTVIGLSGLAITVAISLLPWSTWRMRTK